MLVISGYNMRITRETDWKLTCQGTDHLTQKVPKLSPFKFAEFLLI